MSKSAPFDPMMFHAARRELWTRLIANAGFDGDGHWILSDAQRLAASEEWKSKGISEADYFESFWDEALLSLAGLTVVGELRLWEADGEAWKRPPPQSGFLSVHDPEAVGRFFVDRDEFEVMMLKRYPSTIFVPADDKSVAHEPKAEKRPRGRPPGSKFDQHDAKLVEEMRSLIDAGEALSINDASMKVASKAVGPATFESKARRLRNAYINKEKKGF